MINLQTEDKFYTCRSDRAFKEIFLKEQNRDLLTKLLEEALNTKIISIVEENIERNTVNLKVRRKYLDILLSTDKGLIGIEMNAQVTDYLRARNMAFQCDNYAHYTLVGKKYNEDVQVIQINFTYGLEHSNKTKPLHLELLEVYEPLSKTGKKYVENFKILEFNMDKIMDFWYAKDEEKIKEYKYFIMLDLDKENLSILSKKDKLVNKYMSNLEKLNEDPEFREYMTVEEDQRKIYNTEMDLARKNGLAEGRAEGHAEGLSEGLSQGAKQTSIEIAKKLKTEMSVEKIADITGLTKKEIENL